MYARISANANANEKIIKKKKIPQTKTPPQTNKTLTKLNLPTSSLINTVLHLIFPDHCSESLMQISQTGKQTWENTTSGKGALIHQAR